VHHGAILHVRTVAHRDGSHIATHYSTKPDRAVIAHLNIADYCRVFTEIAACAPLWRQTSVRFYQSHKISNVAEKAVFFAAKVRFFYDRLPLLQEKVCSLNKKALPLH
jgi:hypothetical protein